LACLRHANPTPASTVLHLIRVAFGAQPSKRCPAIFGRRASRKAALHSAWRLGLAVVVAAVAMPVLSLWWAAAEGPTAPTSRQGIHNGAPYRIEVPAGWNGKLVVFAHGYEGEGSGQGSVRTSPLATYLTSQGYAWAASGYRSRGNRPDWFVADTLAVR